MQPRGLASSLGAWRHVLRASSPYASSCGVAAPACAGSVPSASGSAPRADVGAAAAARAHSVRSSTLVSSTPTATLTPGGGLLRLRRCFSSGAGAGSSTAPPPKISKLLVVRGPPRVACLFGAAPFARLEREHALFSLLLTHFLYTLPPPSPPPPQHQNAPTHTHIIKRPTAARSRAACSRPRGASASRRSRSTPTPTAGRGEGGSDKKTLLVVVFACLRQSFSSISPRCSHNRACDSLQATRCRPSLGPLPPNPYIKRHVALADEAYRIGPAPARESYLDAAAVLRAAADAGADAIHPG